jgi:hypothetical protein
MRHLILAISLLSALTMQSFAAHCPAASDFVQTGGYLWGYYWDLTATAANDWHIADKHLINANSPFFPRESILVSTIERSSGEVNCLYWLPDRTGFVVTSNSHKTANLDTIDLNLFLPKHESNSPGNSDSKHWQEDYSITSLSCQGASAGNPEVCHWEWS